MAPATSRNTPLDEARILDSAFRVLEAHGFAGVTIRRIADDLGVQNPALYWHFKNKQQIIDGMAARLLDVLADAPLEGKDWRRWLADAARLYRQALTDVRDGAEVLANANLSRSVQFSEFQRGVAHLATFGFSDQDAVVGMVTVFNYALGITYEQQANARVAGDSRSEGGAVFDALQDMHSRQEAEALLFEGGLAIILDGLALRRVTGDQA